jgi:hypothetical protein
VFLTKYEKQALEVCYSQVIKVADDIVTKDLSGKMSEKPFTLIQILAGLLGKSDTILAPKKISEKEMKVAGQLSDGIKGSFN